MSSVVGDRRGWVETLRTERGAVAIIVALFLVALLVLGALVLDLGSLYAHHRELQSAADAAALAGAEELVLSNGSTASAADFARQYVTNNSAPNSSVVEGNLSPWSPVVDPTSVTVDLRENNIAFSFAQAIGQYTGSVKAHAKAEVKYLTGVNTLFPCALLLMNPEKFRFIFRSGSMEVGRFDITDKDGNGVFGEGGTEGGATLPAVAPGLYSIDLQAITKDADGNEVVGLELPDIGYWWVSDPSNPSEKLYKVGMSYSGGTITVRAQVAAAAVDPTLESLSASFGKGNFSLWRQSGSTTFVGSVSAPTGYDNNTGYRVNDLSITFPKYGSQKADSITCARYVSFADDVPIDYLMMEDSFYSGYSRTSGQRDFQWAEIKTVHPVMWQYFTMKLGAQTGSGLYSGNWRLADIYAGQNVRDEIAEVDPAVLSSWKLNTPLYIGGPLWPEAGAKVGQVWQGLDDRVANWQAEYGNQPDYDPDGWRYVIVPFVNFDPDLSGTSQKYVIQMFAYFRIDSYTKKGNDKGEITGQFVRGLAAGEWTDTQPGPLYVETAVLTQ